MTWSDVHRESVVVTVPVFGAPDDDGVPTRTTSSVTVSGCTVQQVAAAEKRDGAAAVAVERLRVSAPLTETITEACTVTWRGGTYQVEGTPAHFRATGFLDHTEFVMTRARG